MSSKKGEKRTMKKGSKICAGILIGGLLATSGALVACGPNENADATLKSTTDVYSFASATTGILANNQELEGAMAVSASVASTDNASSELEEMKKQIDSAISNTLDKYMNVFDSVVGGSKPVTSIESESDKEGYKHKLTITANSIDGQGKTCVLYFNETLKDGGGEVEDSDEEERETLLEGELYFDDSETPLYVKGVKEVDSQNGETEVAFEAFLVKDDDNNKVVFKQEREKVNGKIEEEYEFEVVVGGQKITEFSFEMEKDSKGNIEVEYEQNIGESIISFEIEKSASNSITISTKDFIGMELEIDVKIEKDPKQGERYVYTVPALEDLKIEGSWRTV